MTNKMSRELPTGTVTFLFSDIEGSTKLWELAPDQAIHALAVHDKIIEGQVERNGGLVVRSRGEGDSRFAVFKQAKQALAAATAIQREIYTEPWQTPQPLRVRIALHTGEADLRMGDYYGSAVNRCARIRSIAHGGQTLLSRTTWELVQDTAPSVANFHDHGEHLLKDLARPERIYELLVPGLPSDFPPLKSLSATLTNITVQATPFVGRQEEMSALQALLEHEDRRLVTLVGPGGIGKTRLAIQVAVDLLDSFPDGAYFVPLAPLNSAGQIVQAIVEALGISLAGEGDLKQLLFRYLRRRRMLLLLDNFEHLLDGATVLTELLQAAPDVTMLATSQEKLNLIAETVFHLSGLGVADWGSPEELLAHSAGELFVQSAQRANPAFELRTEDVRPIAHICRLVEGMPLGIVLAAAWVDQLSPQEIADEVGRSMDFLETEMRDVPARQRSIRAVFEASWERLPEAERDLFKKLSIFRGGFTRPAAGEVAGASMRDLTGLVNKSFLRREPDSGRYSIHELLREYAQEQLEETPEESVSALEAHATYFANFMEQRWQHLRNYRQKEALAEIDADLENIRTAWRYRVGHVNAAQMRMFVNSFWLVYWFRGWNHEGEALFREAVNALSLGHTDTETESVKALALAHQGYFKTWLGFADQGYNLAKESVGILEPLNHPFDLALALGSLNLAADFLTYYDEGEKAARKMLSIATEQDDKWLLAFSLYKVSVANPPKQNINETRRVAQASMDLYEELGEAMISILTLVTLGHAAFALGDHAQAREIYQRCLKTSEAIGYRWGTANAYRYLGQMALALNETVEAELCLLRSLKIADEIGLVRDQVNLLFDIARVQMAKNHLEQAVELLAVVLKQPASRLHRLGGGRVRDRAQELLDTLKARLSTKAYTAAWERGNAREFNQVVIDLLANL